MRFALAIAILGIGLSMRPGTIAAESLPCLPSVEDLVAARLTAISSKHATDEKKIEKKIEHNKSLLDKLILDRINGTYSTGKGFVVTDIDQADAGSSFTATGNSNESWAVTYTIPLNLLRQKFYTDDDLRADHAAILAQQRLERQKEGVDINSQYNDYLEARANYTQGCPDNQCRLAAAYKMRKLAISLLLLTELPEPSNCPSWKCFPDNGNCKSNMQTFLTNVQGDYSDEAKASLDWCIGNSGPADCPERYPGEYKGCVEHGNRSCLMQRAIDLSKSGKCQEAFDLSLICQCHNEGAEQSLRLVGEAFVCSYLKEK